MIVEDEAVVAMDLIDLVEDADAQAIGPFTTVTDSLAALRNELPTVALLDIRLKDGDSYPIAETLSAANVPIVFMSGHAESSVLAKRFPNAPFLVKPASQEAVLKALTSAISPAS